MQEVIDQETTEEYAIYRGDCVEVIQGIPDNSIHYSIFSPPFASLYTYSASPRDMGNCSTHDDFAQHFSHLIPELFRVLKPGRLVSFHCMLLPTTKTRDGFIGITDFRGQLIKAFQDAGFYFHSEVCIWKDPVTAMQRTKALGLLHKQIKKDSCMSRQGIPDYLVTMRKPGVNDEPVAGRFLDYVGEGYPEKGEDTDSRSIEIWQRYASPIWTDINPNDTLQYRSAREHQDERHICPLQLQVIRRGMQMWSNPGDTVLSPFAGIGSEGYESIRAGRRFVGIELKASYYGQMKLNLESANKETMPLFAGVDV